ncbi:MAG: hypothetical protein RLZZ500_1816 [Bacteroidota bacterium]|jgi:hypothetical protein
MATYQKGILGPFAGKVGTVIGANWRGKEILRSLPRKSGKKPSLLQMQQRMKFTAVTEFLTPFNPILIRFYGGDEGEKTRGNKAFAYHIKDALEFVDPDYVIQYEKVILSRGTLPALENVTVTPEANQTVTLTWTDNSAQVLAASTDRVFIGIYALENGQSVCNLSVALRGATTGSLVLPVSFVGKTIHLWIGVSNVSEEDCSTSTYLGTITVQ